MKTLKLSLEKLYEEDSIVLNTVMGTLYGYSEEAIKFFLEGKEDGGRGIPCFIKYSLSGIVTYKDFVDSGLSGTGYISYPKEIKDLIDGKITKEDIINGINERRLITTKFPDEGKEDGYMYIDSSKLKLNTIDKVIKYSK